MREHVYTSCGGFDNCVAYFDGCNWCKCSELGLVCTRKFCPRDEHEEAYCNDCEDDYVLNSDHECIPIGSAQSVNPHAFDDNYDHNYVSSEFRKINETMGCQNNLIYGLIALNLLTITSMVCACSHVSTNKRSNKGYGGIEQQGSDVEVEMIKA